MAVSAGYLTKIRRAVRRNTDTDVDAELTDIIEECRLDLQSAGVISAKTTDETDYLILGAVRSFARWKFQSGDESMANRDDYLLQKDELRRRRDYLGYAITFVVTVESVAIQDALVTFNGEELETDDTGTAIFYYVPAGQNQEYTVDADGYTSVEGEVDVTASATVEVEMEAV